MEDSLDGLPGRNVREHVLRAVRFVSGTALLRKKDAVDLPAVEQKKKLEIALVNVKVISKSLIFFSF